MTPKIYVIAIIVNNNNVFSVRESNVKVIRAIEKAMKVTKETHHK